MFPQWIVAVISFYTPGLDQPGLTLPNPTPEQIQLVKKLGDENFNVREEAQKALEKMDSESYKALLDGATKNPDPEIRARCNVIIPKIMRYNTPKELPNLFGVYELKVKFKSGRDFHINRDLFLKYYYRAIYNSSDSWRDDQVNLRYMTYLLPKASHYLFRDMRLYGYSRVDIDELILEMNKNYKKMADKRSYEHYKWLN